MYSNITRIIRQNDWECNVTGWRLMDELLLMKHWKASDDEWGVCLYVFDWIWLQMLHSDIGSSPGADNITNDITSSIYTCFDNTGHQLQRVTSEKWRTMGDELANTRRIYLSSHH